MTLTKDSAMNSSDSQEPAVGVASVKKIPVVMMASVFLAMVSAVWGVTQSFISYRITENHQLIGAHAENLDKHMPMERKIQLFVLRQEYEKDIREIKEKLDTILKKLEKSGEKR